jgi:lipopolysaccharide/colanic/teichoic acid biosynthesis glycosyltransferase
VDRIVITVTDAAEARTGRWCDRLRLLPNEVTLLLPGDGPGAGAHHRRAHALRGRLAQRQQPRLRQAGAGLVLAGLGLILALPILLLVALAVKWDSPGPILFRQKRHGFNNEVITVWKFRSMRVETSDGQARRQVTAATTA